MIAVPLLSWGTFHLFSSRPRLEASLTDEEDFLAGLAEGLRRRALLAGLLLTLGAAGFLIWNDRWSQTMAASFTFVNVVYLVAIGLDLWDQFRFQRGHGETALLIQLDNVHFSYRLEERLQEGGDRRPGARAPAPVAVLLLRSALQDRHARPGGPSRSGPRGPG